MSETVTAVVVGFAALLAVLAAGLTAGVRVPQRAPGALAALGVLAFGGLGTSVSAFTGCFVEGRLAWPGSFALMLGAWGLALALLLRAFSRLGPLARQARRR